jgi:hypothetical protein
MDFSQPTKCLATCLVIISRPNGLSGLKKAEEEEKGNF